MAREQLLSHRKFTRLIRILKLPRAHALGHLELLYLSAHADANPVYSCIDELECAAGWEGKPGDLAAALIKVGLVDRMRGHRLALHDYWDHCPDYVKKRAARKAAPSGAERRRTADNGRHCPPTDPIPTDPSPVDVNPRSRSGASCHGSGSSIAKPSKASGKAAKAAPEAPEGDAERVSAILAGLGVQKAAKGRPGRMPDFNALTLAELADHAASWETKHDKSRAHALWKSRVVTLSQSSEYLDKFRHSLRTVWAQAMGAPGDWGPAIAHPARWLNHVSRELIREMEEAAA